MSALHVRRVPFLSVTCYSKPRGGGVRHRDPSAMIWQRQQAKATGYLLNSQSIILCVGCVRMVLST